MGIIGEHAVAAIAGEFAGDACIDKQGHGFVGGGEGHGAELAELGQAEKGALAKDSEHAQGVGGAAAGLLDAVSVMLDDILPVN